MDEHPDRNFIQGNPNPWKHGLAIRYANGQDPDPKDVQAAAKLLNREPVYIDEDGYHCEIFGASVHPDGRRVIYLESRDKALEQYLDITIKIHFLDADGGHHVVDIESYNPYFGCDVRMLDWISDDVALLVYREKHQTYIYRIGNEWPPAFAIINDVWQIHEGVLSYTGYKPTHVNRLSVPSLDRMPDITLAEAESLGQLPKDECPE